MHIDALLRADRTRSFEFFPTKSDAEAATLEETLRELSPLEPSFVSVTYRGGAESRQRTFDLVSRIQGETGIVAMAHLICVGHRRDELREILESYLEHGVTNVMALGGDVPDDPALAAADLQYASELVELVKSVGDFSVGVAAHPLGHPRSPSLESDRHYLAQKLAQADFAVTQFFFEAHDWISLVNDLADRGITKPVVPGVIPVTTLSGIPRMATMGAAVPASLVERLERAHEVGGPAAVRQAGIDAATEMCRTLLDEGAPGLHFYTMNRSTATREIHSALYGV